MTSSPSARVSAWTLITICAVLGLDGMDVASMGPALPQIQADLGMSATSLQWIVSAYVIGYGGFVLLGGRLADLFARRRLLIVSLLVFSVASLVGSLADNGTLLIAARLLKGIAAAFSAPAALAILLNTYTEPAERNRALGAFVSTGAVGFTGGLVLGGALAGADWRLTLVLPTILALAIAAAALRVVPPDPAPSGPRPNVDLVGAALVTSGLLALVYGVSNAAAASWGDAVTVAALAGSVALLTAFVAVERVRAAPLVPLGIFARPWLSSANGAALLFQGAYVAFQFIATLYMQDELGWSPLVTGLVFAPGGLSVLLFASRWAGVVTRIGGPWPVAAAGLAVQVGAYLWFALALGAVEPVVLLLSTQLVLGIGYAATYPSLNIGAVANAHEEERGLAGGMFIAATQIGSGVILAVAASVFAANAGLGIEAHQAGAWVVLAAISGAALLALASAARRPALSSAGAAAALES
jgi:MFS family permease